ncbi:hypothetical protein HY212_01105 [Candidatus Pacearchaeota archaeon]|nr:hypothetical protein [Candidatus Pacearchaeota archaeon]
MTNLTVVANNEYFSCQWFFDSQGRSIAVEKPVIHKECRVQEMRSFYMDTIGQVQEVRYSLIL